MAEFDETLDQILRNPAAMEQIARLAQSLSGPPRPENTPPPKPHPASPGTPPLGTRPPGTQPPGTQPPPGVQSPPPPPEPPPKRPEVPPGYPEFPPGLEGNGDYAALRQLLPLLRELGGPADSNARRLLQALRPYLKPERQQKIERALQLARMYCLAKQVLARWEG